MVVNSAESILKRARQMDMARQVGTVRVDMDNLETVTKRLDVLESKINFLAERLAGLMKSELEPVHEKIMSHMTEWTSTADLAIVLKYRQEYVSRKVAELKTAGIILERRNGKRIFYKVAPKA